MVNTSTYAANYTSYKHEEVLKIIASLMSAKKTITNTYGGAYSTVEIPINEVQFIISHDLANKHNGRFIIAFNQNQPPINSKNILVDDVALTQVMKNLKTVPANDVMVLAMLDKLMKAKNTITSINGIFKAKDVDIFVSRKSIEVSDKSFNIWLYSMTFPPLVLGQVDVDGRRIELDQPVNFFNPDNCNSKLIK